MIHRLRLRNWRTYENLDLSIGLGTTFVVAPNGVGKTSLVYGLAWAVFGGYSGIDPKACIRAGTDRAEVAADLDLPDGRRLVITRVVKRRGATRATYMINGTALSERSAQTQMEQALGVELAVASRLAMMLGGGHLAAQSELGLKAHLHHAFGVSHLLEATELAQSVAKQATKARTVFRASTNKRLGDRSALETDIAHLQADIARLEERGVTLEQLRDSTVTQRSLVERHFVIADQLERYEQKRSQLIADAETLLPRPVATDDDKSIVSALRTELQRAQRAVSKATDGTAKERSVIAAAREAIVLLDRDDAVCPTCIRPIATDECDSARSAHKERERNARAEAESLKAAREAGQTHYTAVAQLLARLESLQPPRVNTENFDIPDRAAAEARFQEASRALDEHNRQLGAARSRLESLRLQVASDDQIRQDERDLQQAYRREAVALASAQALREAADRVIESRIEPIATEVRWRWKRLFANEGLTLRADGTIVRVQAGQELGWDTLSGGERTWARIVTHLLVIAATTSLSFAWFDEPLEHLDPQFRHAVAATLATTTQAGTPRQLLVTTYEHTLAQQLANDTDNATIVAIRQTGNYHRPVPTQPLTDPTPRAS